MKKIFFLFFFVSLTVKISYSLANEFIHGYHYTDLKKSNIEKKFKIIEFFSFYCSHCYEFENVNFVNDALEKNLPKEIKIIKYHTSFLGGRMGRKITRAWSLAMILGVEKRVQSFIFDEIQKLNNEKNLKNIFIKATKIRPFEYDTALKSNMVEILLKKQEELISYFGINSVPTILVNGKYIVNLESLDNSSIEKFIYEYISLIKFLLTLD